MSKARRKPVPRPKGDGLFAGKRQKVVPLEFVLDALASVSPTTRPMFGCLAVYVEEQIVLILREGRDPPADNGVWLATATEHHTSLQSQFPHMRSIELFGKKVTNWQVLPMDAPDFEEAALRACGLILARDPRIGKIPKRRVGPKSARKTARSGQGGRGAAKPRK